jgi:hypothetical protein
VPTDNGFGRDDEECLFPAGPASTNEQPEELVEPIEPWAWMTPLEPDELLTKGQIFAEKTVMRTKEVNQRLRNRTLVETKASILLIPRSAGVLAKHRYAYPP